MERCRYAWLVCRALFELARYDVAMAIFGFPAIQARLARPTVPATSPSDPSHGDVCDAMRLACCLHIKPVRCLQRSACLVRLLRQHGAAARLVIGYRPVPFFCHAWAEVDGHTVNDSPVYAKQLSVLYTA